ncbi:MAG: type I secretion system permease/ATPase [Chromatiaceae bacterium]|nr:type I secretion system permease/ATPase [Chromatiaceae bacterium]
MPHCTERKHPIDTGLASLLALARLHGLPADATQLRHAHGASGEDFDERAIVLAGRQLGLKVRAVNSCWERLVNTPLPAIAQHRDGRWFLIAGCKAEGVLVQDPLESRPLTLPRKLFEKSWQGRLILATLRARLDDPAGRFDFGWFLPALMKYRRLLTEVLLASLFLQLFALVTPLFFQVVIDKVLVHKGLTTLDVLAFGLLAIALFEAVLNGLRSYLFSHTTSRVDVVLGARLYRHLLALPVSYFEARRVGDSVARVRELESIRNFLTGSALTLVVDLLFTCIFFGVMYYYSPVLTGVVLAALPCYLLLSLWITPLLRARLNEKFNRGAENQAFLVDSISGVETLKSMAVEPQMQLRWEEQLAAYVRAGFRSGNLGNIAAQIAGLINKVTTVLILWIGATWVIHGELSVGQLIAFNMLAARVSGPLLRLVRLWQDFQQTGISVRRLGDILNTPTEPGYKPGRATPPAMKGEIHFNRVRFRYRPDRPEVLRDIELRIAAGEVVGIVGRSGSGKSTLARLVQRLHQPESGRVLIDGMDLAMLQPAWLRRQVSVVLQENYLFNRSVRDNIALADPGVAMEKIVHAAKLAGAHEFILELAEGYDTPVGERGCALSGGQRQRIAIARALLTHPKVLILDEATSALDYQSEQIIQENMRRICAGRTVLIIAHRLSAVRQADRILVLDQGEIVEQGPHASLLRQRGCYARLHALQNGA